MKPELFYLAVAGLLLWYGLTYAQRTPPPPPSKDIALAGEVIQAEAAPLDRLDAICNLAGRCELASSPRVQPMILTLRLVGLHDGILELSIEREQFRQDSLVYLIHELEQYRIPLRYIDLQATHVTQERPTPTPAVWCDHVQLATLTANGTGAIHSSTTDLLAGQSRTNTPASTLELFFTSLDACHGARQAILDLAEESMRAPQTPQPIGRIGQD